jgi:CarD family transcriptional regulator
MAQTSRQNEESPVTQQKDIATAEPVSPAKTATPSAKPMTARVGGTPMDKLAAVRAAAARSAKPAAGPRAPVASPESAAPAAANRAVPKANGQRHGFKTGEFIVYPAHGVGQIVSIDEQEVAGFKLELFVIHFIKDKMTLRVPTSKVASVGMRKLADSDLMKKALGTLTGRARIKRTMWSRRAQEYEAKINSGDLVAIAEVVRDLYRSDAQPEQSYSERQLYEAALDRMARELSAVQRLTEAEALKLIEAQLQKGPRRGAKVEAEGEADVDADGEAPVDEAA